MKRNPVRLGNLRVVAVSAPHWPRKAATRSLALDSAVPFSLQNAVRAAAGAANRGLGVWGGSNWNTWEGRAESVILMRYWEEDRAEFAARLQRIKPNLLLIGSMTLSFPGALECAALAREILGDRVAIVMGGRHASDTVFRSLSGQLVHTIHSPVKLASQGLIRGDLFDLVVGGPAEDLIVAIGEAVAECEAAGVSPQDFIRRGERVLREAVGPWYGSFVDHSNAICDIGPELGIMNWEHIPVAPELFDSGPAFPVFGAPQITGHAYSDMSRGCVYNCAFCSERNLLNGVPIRGDHGINRLLRHFAAIDDWARQRGVKPSAFVEDSILLGGNGPVIQRFEERLRASNLHLSFGIQLTVDLILRADIFDAVRRLSEVGLDYVAIGMETIDERVAEKMSKNIHKLDPWVGRTEHAIKTLTSIEGVKVGIFVMWGMGETLADRHAHLDKVRGWQSELRRQPSVVSLNWATKHPMGHEDELVKKLVPYHEWGTAADDPRLAAMQEMFGESSARLHFDVGEAEHLPSKHELEGLLENFRTLPLKNT